MAYALPARVLPKENTVTEINNLKTGKDHGRLDMRPLEAFLVGLTTLSVISLLMPRAPRARWMPLLPAAGMVLLAAHRLLEGCRRQMVPIYTVGVVSALITVPSLRLVRVRETTSAPKKGKWLRLFGTVLSLLALALGAVLAVLFPYLRLPTPLGPYAIGTMNLHFIDRERPETFTPSPDDHHELFARVWYPAEIPAGARPVSYCENAHEVSRAVTGPTPFPSFLFDHLSRVSRPADSARIDPAIRAAPSAGHSLKAPVPSVP